MLNTIILTAEVVFSERNTTNVGCKISVRASAAAKLGVAQL